MLFNAITVLSFLGIGVAIVALGHFMKRQELYIFGVLTIFFMGLFIIENGVSEQIGESLVLNTSLIGNDTILTSSATYVYDSNVNLWTNALGLLSVIASAGLALTWWSGREKEKKRKEESVEIEEE